VRPRRAHVERISPRVRVGATALAGLAVAAACPARAWAVDVENVGGETLTLDITNTSAWAYHFDNRNDFAQGTPSPVTLNDDKYGEWLDRLNVQLFWWRLRAGVRVDTATYGGMPSDTKLYDTATKRIGPGATGVQINDYYNAFRRDLHTRFRNTYYPSKLFLGYTAPGVDLTLGDFYAQLGRGLVFSVRKVDEIATDTTVRGAKAQFKPNVKGAQLSATIFAGQMNPIRVDEASGRQLTSKGSPLFFGFPKGSDFTSYNFDDQGHAGYVTEGRRPGYIEDSVVGGGIEAGPKWMTLGGNASWLFRKSYDTEYLDCTVRGRADCAALYPVFDTTNQARLHNRIFTASGSVNFPKLGEVGDLYVEVATQKLGQGRATATDGAGGYTRVPDRTGYAVYVSTTVRGGPVSVNFEGKHYRSFFPLSGNINASTASDPSFSAPEFDFVAYNQVPTAEPIYVEQLGQPNLCVTGGRARADFRLSPKVAAYTWVGHYVSFSEIDANNFECKTDEKLRTGTWDAAIGGEMSLEGGKSNVKAWVGARNTNRAEAVDNVNTSGATDAFYREGYVRYDITKHIAGAFSIQAQGLHRHRYEPLLTSDSWNEGENYTALHWSPHFAFIFGYEYLGRRGCTPDPKTTVCHYFNGGLQFRAAETEKAWAKIFDTISLFVGQRRGAIRCVSGVCRQFPPFEGARLELVSRF
jgi:hypothetical protein